MKRILAASVLALLAVLPACAVPPTPESVEKLLILSQASKGVDLIATQVPQMMERELRRVLQGVPLTANDEMIIQAMKDGATAAIADNVSWDKVKPGFIRAYTEAFSQEDVDNLVAFFSTPTGKAYAEREPAIVQKTQTEVQQQLMPLLMTVARRKLEEAAQKIEANHPEAAKAPASAQEGAAEAK